MICGVPLKDFKVSQIYLEVKTLISMNIAHDHHNRITYHLLSYKGNLRPLYACSHE